jgi:hypothetical protein
MQIVPHHDPRVHFEGQVSLQRTEEFTQPWRIPVLQRGLFPHVDQRAAHPAGVRISIRTDSSRIAGAIAPPDEQDLRPIDLVIDGKYIDSHPLKETLRFAFDIPGNGMRPIELWLPQFGEFRLRHLEIDDGATIQPHTDTRPRWITYGSSITQSRQADHPSATWAAQVARSEGLSLMNLGFGGQCHLDGMVARMIRDTPADYLSACLGINMHGGSVGPRTFVPGIINLVQTIREKHPRTPFVLISPIFAPSREHTPNQAGWTLPLMRQHVQEACDRLRAAGDAHLFYVNGLDLFGPDDAHLLPDELHPNHQGQSVIAERFKARVVEPFFRSARSGKTR